MSYPATTQTICANSKRKVAFEILPYAAQQVVAVDSGCAAEGEAARPQGQIYVLSFSRLTRRCH